MKTIDIKTSLNKRTCGECHQCCILLEVNEIQKPEGTKCKHCNTNCSIYENRPLSCKNFECGWLKGDLDEHMRPDKSGVLIEILPSDKIVLALTIDHNMEIPQSIIDEYHRKNKAILARANRTYIPNNMSKFEVDKELFRVAALMGY